MVRRTLVLCVLMLFFLGIQAVQAAYVGVQEDASSFSIATSRLMINIPKAAATITVQNRAGDVILQESGTFAFRTGGVYYWITTANSCSVSGDRVTVNCSTNQTGRTVRITLDFLSASVYHITFEANAGTSIEKCRESYVVPADEHYYGLGEPRTGTLDLRGRSVDNWVYADLPDGANLVPFYVSNKGYGICVDSYYDGNFDFASSDPVTTKMVWMTPKMGYYFFYGPSFAEIIQQFMGLSGTPPLPPKWQFGLAKWLQPQGTNQAAIIADAQRFITNDIPASMIWLEPQWQTGMNTFTFRSDIFPDPAGMVSQLNTMGFHVTGWMTTFIDELAPIYAEASTGGYFVMNSTGLQPWLTPYTHHDYYTGAEQYANRGFMDFTNTAAVAWWRTQLQKGLAYGLEGYKIDRGQEILDSCKFANGETGKSGHNKYGYYIAKTQHDYLSEQLGNEFALILKSGTFKSQRYTTLLWSGDQPGDFSANGLPGAVQCAQNAAVSGFPYWTSDIGGWRTTPTKENYIRWAAFSAFTPSMESPYGPWQFDQQTTDIFRIYAKMHYEMIPYFYSLAEQAHQTGLPIIRPLVYNHPSDSNVANQGSEFMLGNQLLIAPVLEPNSVSRNVYLPKGCWTDFWDNSKVYTGPITLSVSTPLDKIPVFIKGGSIIPIEQLGHADTIMLDTYPRGQSAFKVYLDGTLATVYSSYSGTTLKYLLPGLPKNVLIRAKTQAGAPTGVMLNGSALTNYSDATLFSAAAQGWMWDAADGRLLIKYAANTTATVEVDW